MARTVRNPLELRTPVRTISSVMRNAPREKYRPNQVDFGRPEQGDQGFQNFQGIQNNLGNLTSVARPPRGTTGGNSVANQGVNAPISRGTNAVSSANRVQKNANRAPQSNVKPTVTSTIKTPAAKTLTAAKPVASKTTTSKPAATKTPITSKTTTAKAPVAAKTTTTKAPIAAKTTTPIAAKTTTPVVPKTVTTAPVKPTTSPTNPLTSVLKNAAVGAGAATLINSLVNKPTTPVVKPPSTPPVVKPPVTTPVVKPPVVPTSVVKPPVVPTSVVKPPVTPTKTTSSLPSTAVKTATGALTAKGLTGTTDKQLTDEEIQAELDRAKAEQEPIGLPEGAELQPDGTYTVTANGMVTTYDKDGNMLGAEADPNELTTWNDPDTGLTWNKGADGQWTQEGIDSTSGELTTWNDPDTGLTWNKGPDGEWTQEGLVSSDNLTTWNDPDTGLTWNLGADGQWTQEGFDSSSNAVTTWSDPDTGFTWNLGADGQWTQEGFDGTSGTGFDNVDNVDGVDTSTDFSSIYTPKYISSIDGGGDGSGGSGDGGDSGGSGGDGGGGGFFEAKGGSIHFKHGAPRFATAGSVNPSAYSDTTEEVQPWQNVDSNYTEASNGPITGSQSLYQGNAPYNPTYLSSSRSITPDGWPDGYIDNYDGTATRIEDDGSTTTIDADSNIVFTTNSNGEVTQNNIPEGQGTGLDLTPENWPDGFVSNGDGTATRVEDDGSTTTIDSGNNIVYTTDSNGQPFNSGDSNTPTPIGPITSTGGGQDTGFAKLNAQNQDNQPDQSGVFNSLLNAVKNNPALAGGAVGALLSSFMDQSGGGDSSTNTPVDISQLTSFNPRTTDFGAGMVGGRTGTGSPLVSYSDYAEGYGDETPDDRLYSDLGISGWLREPDMNNYRDENGSLTDQSGNLVDEYGYLLDDGSGDQVPEEETPIEDTTETTEEPTMASGGTTHYTFGRVINPADNLNINMKMGGLSQAHTAHSHQTNPVIDNRVDFRKGSAVNGAGDGQSDDIPAWLADGEYVMDAELVSMLGNGSNKAGAKILDKFREEVRSHKRSAPLGKIPPKAKSPLNYLKESLNG